MSSKLSILETYQELGNQAAEQVARQAIENKQLLAPIYDGVTGSNKRIKNAAAKTLQILSAREPILLYPKFTFFVQLMNSDDTILKWIAIDVIGNVSAVDTKNRINKTTLQALYDLLSDESMITAAHAITALGTIAAHKPRRRKEITNNLLSIEKIKRNPECRNILIGHTILALTEYIDQLRDKKAVLLFARRALKNSRHATRKKAETFLKVYSEKS
jgi:hypothetical protein